MFGDTELWFIDDEKGLARMVAELEKASVIGVDTESDSFHHYREKVCLIQFSDAERDYIVDPLAIDDISPLGDILADPDVVVILHGADYDVVCLRRDFDFEVNNIFDTMIAAQMAGLPRVGLADLIERYFGHVIDKQYQRHDWARRPLKDEHIQYARGDTHFLLAIRELLIRELRRVGRLAHVREENRLIEKKDYAPPPPDPHKWLRTKGSNHLNDDAKRVLKHLWEYRESEAEKADRPAFKILPSSVLVKAAEHKPTSLDDLDRLFKGKHAMKRRYGKGIVRAVKAGIADDAPVPDRPPKKKKKRRKGRKVPTRLRGQKAERAHAALKQWRNELLDRDDSLSPITVASNAILKNVAEARPTTLEELRKVPEVRRWQVRDFGEDLLAVLDKAVPWDPDAPDDDDDDEESAKGGRKGGRRRRRRR